MKNVSGRERLNDSFKIVQPLPMLTAALRERMGARSGPYSGAPRFDTRAASAGIVPHAAPVAIDKRVGPGLTAFPAGVALVVGALVQYGAVAGGAFPVWPWR